jgi:hypothetical protein
VTATPTLTRSRISTWVPVPAGPLDLSRTGFGVVAGIAVMPARYCLGAVPAGTATRNGTASCECGLTVTVFGRPVTQQPIPAHGVASGPKALPELAAVTPSDVPSRSVIVVDPTLPTTMTSRAERPGATLSL